MLQSVLKLVSVCAVCCSVSCSMLQCVAVCCSVLQRIEVYCRCSVLQRKLQRVAMCCRVCCSDLKCVAVT